MKSVESLTVRYCDDVANRPCALCGEAALYRQGPRLCLENPSDAVCRTCGKRHAPHLAGLLDLAQVAEKVGRLIRPLLTPPMEALLDLARAAENYSQSTPKLQPRPR